jgi:hypothetical protein
MLKVDKNIFDVNLSLTKEYCRLQMEKKQNDTAKIFRTYNPLLGDNLIFSFEVEHFDFDIEPNINFCTLTKWSIDPTEQGNEIIVDQLFEQQIHFKEKTLVLDKAQTYQGDILISQIDCTVIDGASEVQSLGLIDIYDMPPIDTWFYLTKSKESRLLFSWIPKEYKHYANEAVLVNCVDCINWLENWYPDEYKNMLGN